MYLLKIAVVYKIMRTILNFDITTSEKNLIEFFLRRSVRYKSFMLVFYSTIQSLKCKNVYYVIPIIKIS